MKTGDSNTGERSEGEWGKGYHLSTVGDYGVECPICTCYNDPDYLFGKICEGYQISKVIKCVGCKRKVNVLLNPFTGAFTLTEILK